MTMLRRCLQEVRAKHGWERESCTTSEEDEFATAVEAAFEFADRPPPGTPYPEGGSVEQEGDIARTER